LVFKRDKVEHLDKAVWKVTGSQTLVEYHKSVVVDGKVDQKSIESVIQLAGLLNEANRVEFLTFTWILFELRCWPLRDLFRHPQ